MTLMTKAGVEPLRVTPEAIEEAAKLLYIRALKILPDDIKQGFARLDAGESDGTAKAILATMIENIGVAERTDNLLCQDTGIPIFNVTIGRNVELAEAGDPARHGARDAGASAPQLRRPPHHAEERAHQLRRACAGDQPGLRGG
jgi:fumarate hydratase subunit alpha/L(+)-tartrate dehydratase alpha subunit